MAPSPTPRLSIAGLPATSSQAWSAPAEAAAVLPPRHLLCVCVLFLFFFLLCVGYHVVKKSFIFHETEILHICPFMHLYMMHITLCKLFGIAKIVEVNARVVNV